jgi:hypothetical protein
MAVRGGKTVAPRTRQGSRRGCPRSFAAIGLAYRCRYSARKPSSSSRSPGFPRFSRAPAEPCRHRTARSNSRHRCWVVSIGAAGVLARSDSRRTVPGSPASIAEKVGSIGARIDRRPWAVKRRPRAPHALQHPGRGAQIRAKAWVFCWADRSNRDLLASLREGALHRGLSPSISMEERLKR